MTSEIERNLSWLAGLFVDGEQVAITMAPYSIRTNAEGSPAPQPELALLLGDPNAAKAERIYEEIIIQKAKEFGFEILMQLDETRDGPFMTVSDYGRDARRFSNTEKTVDDGRHMNSDYGKLVLDQYLNSLP